MVKVIGDLGQRPFINCLSTFLKDISSNTSGPTSINFQAPRKDGKKVLIFGPGHMTMIAAMTRYSKSPRTTKPIFLKPDM